MKRTYRKLLYRAVQHSFSRFLAIFAIVALGTGFLAGLMATSPDMRLSVDHYYDENAMMDIRILSTLGLTDEDVQSVRQTAGVAQVMPSHTADALLRTPQAEEFTARIHSLPADGETALNQVVLTEGRMPTTAGECLLLTSGYGTSTAIGDVLTFSPEAENPLTTDQLTVVGKCVSAYYLSIEKESSALGSGKIDRILFTPAAGFAADIYSELFVTVAGAAELDGFSDKYTALVDDVQETLKTTGQSCAARRTAELRADAERQISEGQETYDTQARQAAEELRQARERLTASRQQIADSEAQLDTQQQALEAAKTQLTSGRAALEEQKSAFAAEKAAGEQALQEKQAALTALAQQLAALQAAGDPAAAAVQAQYTAAATALKAAEAAAAKQLTEAQAAITAAETELSAGEQQQSAGAAALEQGRARLAEAKKALESGEADYAAAEKEADTRLTDAAAELAEARKALDELQPAEWYVLDRGANVGFVSFSGNAEKVEAIAKVFPIFFFLVAALVCLTTMTRMVEEERLQIGTLKALGYSSGTIAAKYLLYAAAATLLGSLFGLCIGLRVFPTVIWGAYGILYTQPPLYTPFRWEYALPAFAGCLACTMGATLSACISTLREQTARLLLPRAPKAGKRVFLEHITPLWKRMKFTHKVTARNLLRYKKRFWMTVIGVAGCTALLLTGFGLRDSINHIVSNQYETLDLYDLTITLENDAGDEAAALTAAYAPTGARQESGKIAAGGNEREVLLFVPSQPEQIDRYIRLQERKTGTPQPLTDDGILLTEKLANQLGVRAGDTVTLRNADDRTAECTVTGIVENYIYHYAYITPTLYEQTFGSAPEANRLLCRTQLDADGRDALATQLLALEDVAGVSFSQDIINTFNDVFNSINYIVLVLIICAAALAFVVLYNLTNINIAERQKEIATIKVLGFWDKEVYTYVFRETAILTLLGSLLGLVIGVFLCRYVVATAEVDIVMFGRDIYAASYLYAAAITWLFGLLVSLVMRRRLRNIDMVESMKAGE